jgi:hypothetical protein
LASATLLAPVTALLLGLASPAGAAEGQRRDPAAARAAPRVAVVGRPKVKLNRLTFPSMPQASYYKKHLERSLQREARKADWGAGEGSVIHYRVRIDSLRIEAAGDVVRVHCSATGELPNGKSARSRLSFSGSPAAERKLVEEVLGLVARGLVTRLAELEHRRRT